MCIGCIPDKNGHPNIGIVGLGGNVLSSIYLNTRILIENPQSQTEKKICEHSYNFTNFCILRKHILSLNPPCTLDVFPTKQIGVVVYHQGPVGASFRQGYHTMAVQIRAARLQH
jgi:hypothetical protein